ncbi:hypothetical protein D9758_010352 [Tetrapyrgos nigripes]|uniref:Uncharacterized protein n=1 Tax=Tetrapyrgos nigripes TaxID=182062 RepID=A0A8H5CZE2_9AGAR|nr:hypothetical protein D9758_010352 [Tetrapyrgos nigripes]
MRVSGDTNQLVWTCNTAPAQQFTVLIANHDQNFVQAIIAQQNNFDCSKLITTDMFSAPVGSGYTVQLADILNSTHIYAESKPFDVKPLASGLPATTVSPQTATSSGGSTAGATGSNSAAGATNTNAAVKTVVGYSAAAFGALLGLVL